jgi:hypothetical protein
VAVALVLGAAACSSSSHVNAAGGSSIQAQCTTVANVLSDGPDPDADSVGYAEAQVLPLQQLLTQHQVSDAKLETDIANLAAAYKTFSSGGGAAAAITVTKAESVLNDVCSGAAP